MKVAECGTDSGYYHHLRQTKTPTCGPCRQAHSVAEQKRSSRESVDCPQGLPQVNEPVSTGFSLDRPQTVDSVLPIPAKRCNDGRMSNRRKPNVAEQTARDQLRILAANGWSTTTLANITGYTATALYNVRNASERISADLLATIDVAYERLWWKEGPAQLTATRASRAGWDTLWVEPASIQDVA